MIFRVAFLVALMVGAIACTGVSAVSPTQEPTATVTVTPSVIPTVRPTLEPLPSRTPVPPPSLAPGNYYVTGKVTDSQSGKPVNSVTVLFYPAVDNLCFYTGGHPELTSGIAVKDDGSYRLPVPKGVYYAQVSVPQGVSYIPQYYNGKLCSNYDKIVVDKDTVVDFSLQSK